MGASVSVVPDQTLTKEQAKELAGDKFDEALFDEYADADGLVSGQAFKEAAKITWSVNDRSPSRDLAQSLQELRPVCSWYLPASQPVQAACAACAALLCVPAPQSTHWPALPPPQPSCSCPAGQL